MFVNKTQYDVAIPPDANDTLPITFATASFMVHVVSPGTSSANLNGWVPYALVIVSGVAFFALVGIATTCLSQDLCCSCRSSVDTPDGEKLEEKCVEGKESEDPSGDIARSASKKRRLTEYIWGFPSESNLRPETREVIPYEVTSKPGAISRRKTLMVKPKKFVHDQNEYVVQTAISDAEGIQRVNTGVGMPFTVGINLTGGSFTRASIASQDPQPRYRAQVVPFSPSWMHFCPEQLILWGTPTEPLAPAMFLKFHISLIANNTDLVVGKLRLKVSSPKPAIEPSLFFSDVFTGTEKGVWYEHINGIDTLNILSETTYTIQYHPRALAGQQIQPGRYYFKFTQALPPWLVVNSNPLEIKGDTTGYKRRDLRDLWVVDRFTERVIAKLRVTLVIAQEWN
ncbi:hypothetical protein RhiJN_25746 [Ceratobasidium sp. AG-Ba]|nr:hypothetical protein RhiJN_25746 [Ceratobasidium sp. AG-Ba]